VGASRRDQAVGGPPAQGYGVTRPEPPGASRPVRVTILRARSRRAREPTTKAGRLSCLSVSAAPLSW